MLSWTDVEHARDYEVVQGRLESLPDLGRGLSREFTCLDAQASERRAFSSARPRTGDGYWYLVRPIGCLAHGSFDTAASSQIAPRAIALHSIRSCRTEVTVTDESSR